MAPHRDQYLGDSSGFGRVLPCFHTREVGRRRSDVASHTVGSRSSLCVAALGPVCRPTVPPFRAHRSAVYAEGHGRGMQATMTTLDVSQQRVAGQLATLPMRMGGLGSRSAARIAPAAYWASWRDALHMIHRRLPQIANSFIQQVENGEAVGCVGELQNACRTLDRSGFVGPTWAELRSGARPPPVSGSMAGSTARLPLSNTIIGRP